MGCKYFYGWTMSQKLILNDFKWVEYILKFNENFIKSYDDESEEGCFYEVDVQYPENLNNLLNELPFFWKKNWKTRKACS